MGNSESSSQINVDKEEYQKYIDFKKSQELLKKLNSENIYKNHTKQSVRNNILPNITDKQRFSNINKNYNNNNNNDKNTNFIQKPNLDQIDPFELLKKNPNLKLEELKKNYKKLSLIHHPDRGGAKQNFIRIINAINRNENDKLTDSEKSHQQLKNNYLNTDDNTSQNLNLNSIEKDFKIDKFNQVFDSTKIEDVNSNGYGHLMVKSSKNRDDIEVKNNIGKYDKNKFNDKFNSIKRSNSKSIQRYKVPESLNSNGLNYTELGGQIDDFSCKIQNTIYTDYKKAFDNNFLIDPLNTNYKKYKNVNELEKDRDNKFKRRTNIG